MDSEMLVRQIIGIESLGQTKAGREVKTRVHCKRIKCGTTRNAL